MGVVEEACEGCGGRGRVGAYGRSHSWCRTGVGRPVKVQSSQRRPPHSYAATTFERQNLAANPTPSLRVSDPVTRIAVVPIGARGCDLV